MNTAPPKRFAWLVQLWCIIFVLTAVIVSWIFSFWFAHGINMTYVRRYGLICASGTIQLQIEERTNAKFDGLEFTLVAGQRVPGIGFSSARPYFRGSIKMSTSMSTASGPVVVSNRSIQVWGITHWVVAIVLMLPLAWCLRRQYKARQLLGGFCRGCGYDLRATPDRCPECGRQTATTL